MLLEYIGDLDGYAGTSLAGMQGNKVLRRFIERTLHLAVGACLDSGNHLIADLRLREPQDYKDIMTVLSGAGYLPAARLGEFQKDGPVPQRHRARLRLYQAGYPYGGILRKGPADLRMFAAMVRDNFLAPEKPAPS